MGARDGRQARVRLRVARLEVLREPVTLNFDGLRFIVQPSRAMRRSSSAVSVIALRAAAGRVAVRLAAGAGAGGGARFGCVRAGGARSLALAAGLRAAGFFLGTRAAAPSRSRRPSRARTPPGSRPPPIRIRGQFPRLLDARRGSRRRSTLADATALTRGEAGATASATSSKRAARRRRAAGASAARTYCRLHVGVEGHDVPAVPG